MTNIEKQVINLHKEGLIDVAIATKISKSPDTVAYYRKKHNLVNNFTKEYDIPSILTALKNGETNYSISKKFLCSSTFLTNLCIKHNIKTRTRKEFINSVQIVKENPFNDLTNKNSNYWLGMLAADGAIFGTKVVLTLQEKDKLHVEKYKNFVNSNLNIYKSTKLVGEKSYHSFGISFRNKKIVNYLDSIGLTAKKSFTLNYKLPITVDFLRGVIDGDGYIRNNGNEVSIATGSKIFAKQLQNFIIQKFKVNCTIREVKNLYIVGVYGRLQVKELLKIYENADTYLDRKYFKAMLLRNK